jgi:SAM-dependent methyltransferase
VRGPSFSRQGRAETRGAVGSAAAPCRTRGTGGAGAAARPNRVATGRRVWLPDGEMTEDLHVRVNRLLWNQDADDYQRRNAPQIREQAFSGDLAWGLWAIPESRLGVLGEVAGKDVLELGCGGAQWSMALARRGARPVGLDLSERQLGHGRRLMREAGVRFPLVHGDAERVPFGDGSFDVVFADHGAFSFADPYRTVPESARVLRRGGLLAFNHLSPIYQVATPMEADHAGDRLVYDYFGLRRLQGPDGTVEFDLPYGAWIRLFRDCGLVVEDLIEPRPAADATSTYRDAADLAWARRWPAECIWRARRA